MTSIIYILQGDLEEGKLNWWACSMHGGGEKCIKYFSQKTSNEVTIWETITDGRNLEKLHLENTAVAHDSVQ